MELVLGCLHLSWMGGATTYLLTVAPALQRLGHDVTLYSPDAGATAELARSRGIQVAEREQELPDRCDGVLVQDTVMALELADRYPQPQLFVSHGAELDLAVPPQLPRMTSTIVAMNDRVEARARALAVEAEVVRLRQPVDIEQFRFRGPGRDRPAVALMLGNYLRGERLAVLVEALDELGIRGRQLGRHGTEMTADPGPAIADADMVIGYGRSVLEAMSCGRPAYVFDHIGADGWVTPDTYEALERDGFAGMAFDRRLDGAELRRDLATYEPALGLAGAELVWSRHSSFEHARSLVPLFDRAAATEVPRAKIAREFARVVRSQWHADWRAQELGRELTETR